MKNELIEALKKEGTYIFLVETNRKQISQVKGEWDLTMREDKIQLDKDDSYDIDVQKQIDEYMLQNDIIKISLNGINVWEAPVKKCIDINYQHGRMY